MEHRQLAVPLGQSNYRDRLGRGNVVSRDELWLAQKLEDSRDVLGWRSQRESAAHRSSGERGAGAR